MASFKLACPSCEFMVPIKNENQIGTKVECPKCKYRFRVEAPADGVSAGDDAPASVEKRGPGASSSSSSSPRKSKKGVAIVVGVLAVAVLAAVGYAVLSGGDKNKNASRPGGSGTYTGGSGSSNSNTDTTPTEDTSPKSKAVSPSTPKRGVPASDKETTNLLPTQTVSVVRFDIERLRTSPATILTDRTVLNMLADSLGLDLDQISTYLHAYVGERRVPFGVIRLREPHTEKEIVGRIKAVGVPKSVKKKWTLYEYRNNPLQIGVANAFSLSSILTDLWEKPPAEVSDKEPRPTGLCVYDTQHILVGDHATIEQFLDGLTDKGYPKLQSDVGPPREGVAPAENPLYLTIDPKLKRLLKDLGGEQDTPPLVVFAQRFVPGSLDATLFKKDLQPVSAFLNPVLDRTDFVGLRLNSFTGNQLTAAIRLVMKNDAAAFEAVREQLTPGLTTVAQALTLFLGTPIEFRNLNTGSGYSPGAGGMFTPGGPLGPPPMGGPGGSLGPPPMGGPGGPLGPPLGGAGSSVGPPPLGGAGSSLGPPPLGAPGGALGMPPVTGPGFRPDENTGDWPPIGGPGQTPGLPNPMPGKSASFLGLGQTDQSVTISIELNWTTETFRTRIEPRLMAWAETVRAKVAVFASDLPFYRLSTAIPLMISRTQAFPRGTVERRLTDTNRLGLKHPPYSRISFFSELLPYLGRDALAKSLDPDEAWNKGRNLDGAEVWVSELLVPGYPQSSWRVTSREAAGRVLGATNFVAIAGVGLDAPRYDPNDPANAKKLGICGYEWGSRVEEVKDGLAYTIYLMQTPPGLPQPWIAGGGATIRGLDEKDPMRAFAHTIGTPGGKPGTFALMADGTVRFIPRDIKKEVLLAMATRAGGEDISAVIDREAPVVYPVKPKPEAKPEPKPRPDDEPRPVRPPSSKLEVAPPPREK